MTCVITLGNVMDTQNNPQFSLEAIAYFEWDKSMGIALKSARNKQNISLRNLALKISTQSKIDLSFGYLSDLETGKNDSVKKDKLLAITKALGISVNDLYFHK